MSAAVEVANEVKLQYRHKPGAVNTGFVGQASFISYNEFNHEQYYNHPGLLGSVPGSKMEAHP